MPDKGELEYDAEEQALVDTYHLTEDQIRWRRYKIVEVEQLRLDGSSRSLFAQEYPEDDESCFLVSGDMYYDVIRLNELERQCHRPIDMVLGAKIWNHPEKDVKYYCGIDPGLGKVSHSVAQIWHFYFDKDGKEHAIHDATLGGLIPPERMAPMVAALCKYYNQALACPEVNIDSFIKMLSYGPKPYYNVYLRRDIVSGRIGREYGWYTNIRTKRFMLEEIARMLPLMETHDHDVVSQMRNIRYDSVREQAFSIGADDYHDATGLAIVCRESIPVRKGFVGSSGYNW